MTSNSHFICPPITPATDTATPADGGDANTKLVYIKRWRTIIKVPEQYADEIVDALRALPASPLRGREQPNPSGYWQDMYTDLLQYTDALKQRVAPTTKQIEAVLDDYLGVDSAHYEELRKRCAQRIVDLSAAPPEQPAALPLAVRLRDEASPPLPQMVAQRRAQLSQEQPAAPAKSSSGDKETK